jgi:multiple sugar transport system permease protein
MPAPKRKRLPSDFFDRLLSNQTDEQINDLLSSLVDEQISPTPESSPERAVKSTSPVLTAKKRLKEFHRDKIEDSIVTQDEALDEPQSRVDEVPGQEHALPVVPPKSPEKVAVVVPQDLPTEPQLDSAAPDFKEADLADWIEKANVAHSEEVHLGKPVEFFRDGIQAAEGADEKTDDVPTVDLTAPLESNYLSAASSANLPPSVVPTSSKQPVTPAPSADPGFSPAPVGRALSREQLRRARRKVRWERPPLRAPKLPKMAVPSPPIAFKVPKSGLDFGFEEGAVYHEKVRRISKIALLYLLPAFLGFSLFSWYPMLKGFFISLFHYAPLGTSTYIGAANYARAFHDPMFWKTIYHAGGFCVLVLVLGFWLPIVFSMLVNELKWGRGMLKFVFFLPFLMPSVPAAILWKWILDQGFGLANALVGWLGFQHPHIGWLTSPPLALLSIALLYIWKNTGWCMLIYSAALSNIDETLYEEAELDGANVPLKIWHITLPSLRSVTSAMLIITIINTLQIFTEVYILTNGGPLNATEMIATYIYKQAFFYMDIGYASALSFLLLVMLLAITLVRLRRLEPEE